VDGHAVITPLDGAAAARPGKAPSALGDQTVTARQSGASTRRRRTQPVAAGRNQGAPDGAHVLRTRTAALLLTVNGGLVGPTNDVIAQVTANLTTRNHPAATAHDGAAIDMRGTQPDGPESVMNRTATAREAIHDQLAGHPALEVVMKPVVPRPRCLFPPRIANAQRATDTHSVPSGHNGTKVAPDPIAIAHCSKDIKRQFDKREVRMHRRRRTEDPLEIVMAC